MKRYGMVSWIKSLRLHVRGWVCSRCADAILNLRQRSSYLFTSPDQAAVRLHTCALLHLKQMMDQTSTVPAFAACLPILLFQALMLSPRPESTYIIGELRRFPASSSQGA